MNRRFKNLSGSSLEQAGGDIEDRDNPVNDHLAFEHREDHRTFARYFRMTNLGRDVKMAPLWIFFNYHVQCVYILNVCL